LIDLFIISLISLTAALLVVGCLVDLLVDWLVGSLFAG
jgi:hypothetical protein